MTAWLLFLFVVGSCSWAGGQELYPTWAAGVDASGKAAVSTSADGLVMIESPDFPAGIRFAVTDDRGNPLAGVDVAFQGYQDSLFSAKLSHESGRLKETTVWGKSSLAELAVEMQSGDNVEGIQEAGVVLSFDRITQFEKGRPSFFRLIDLVDRVRTALPNEAGRWLIMLEGGRSRIEVAMYQGDVLSWQGEIPWSEIEEWRIQLLGNAWSESQRFEVADDTLFNLLGIESPTADIDVLSQALMTRVLERKPDRWQQIDERSLLKVVQVDVGTVPPGFPTILNLSNDLSGQDLREVDLRGANLKGLNLKNALFDGVSFKEVDLTGVDFALAHLTRVDFSGIDLTQANLWGAKLFRANLSGQDLKRTTLRGADLTQADLRRADLSGLPLKAVVLRDALIDGTDLTGVDLEDAIWVDGERCFGGVPGECVKLDDIEDRFIRGEVDTCVECVFGPTDLSGVDLAGANLRRAVLRNVDLRESDLDGANFQSADLSGANLSGLDLRNTNLRNATLDDADLTGVNLRQGSLPGAGLRNADLTDAHLEGAFLRANLHGAILVGAFLDSAFMKSANLTSADLSFASLRGADLSRADLTGARLEGADFTGTLLGFARWVDGDRCTEDSVSECVTFGSLTALFLSGESVECPSCPLSGESLRHLNLQRATLSAANLDSVDLSGVDMSEADLGEAYLRNADLSGANLRGANLNGARLQGANLSGADLQDANLSGADLRNVDFEGANVENANLAHAGLRDAVWVDGSRCLRDSRGACNSEDRVLSDFLSGISKVCGYCDLRETDLSNVSLRGADLSGVNLSDAGLSGRVMDGVSLLDADLNRADLSGADLSGASLERANLRDADLSDAYLQGAYLARARLQGANLQGADLRRASLVGADLDRAILRNADLRRANLSEARFNDVDLRGANLRGAFLSGVARFIPTVGGVGAAEFTDSDLSGATWVNGRVCADGSIGECR